MIELPTESEPVTVVEGDCLDVLPFIESVAFTLITDPPYGVELGRKNDKRRDRRHLGKRSYSSDADTHAAFVADVVPRLNAYLDICTRAAVFSGPNIHEQRKPAAIGGIYCPTATGRTSWGFKNFLPVLLYGTAPDLNLGSKNTVLVSNAKAEENGHPCPKLLDWMRWLIRLASRPGDLIIDPFGGSGTTAVAALHEGRRCLIVEKDEKYCDIIRRRVAEAQGVGKGSLLAPAAGLFDDCE